MSPTRRRRFRTASALAIVLLFVGVIVFRLVDIQVVKAEELNADALAKRGTSEVLFASRGDIVDRNGEILAETSMRYNVNTSPKDIAQIAEMTVGEERVEVSRQEAFAAIGAITGQTPEELAGIVDGALAADPASNFAYLKQSIDLAQLNALKDLGIAWLYFEQNPDRIYPSGAVGGNLVGYVGGDGEPLQGLELAENACLAETDGELTYERSADSIPIPGSEVVTKEAVDGGTLRLTIDQDLQWRTQQLLQDKVTSTQAEYGMAVVVDAKTGELLAVADNDTVDPNDFQASGVTNQGSRAFGAPYEPGSTFKTITAAALIDQGLANPMTQVETPYTFSANGASFTDANWHPVMPYTLTGVLVNSSNVGISTLGQQLSPEVRGSYLEKFGIGQETGIGFPGESSGMLAPAADWDAQTTYTTMFGQGLSSTILQTAGVYQTIANGGVRVPLSLVDACVAADGTETEPERAEPVQVIAPETASQVTGMLEAVVNEGWINEHISIPGYRLAGKTGTAEQSDGQGGYRSDYVYSFAGFFPADDPQYVAVFTLAFPKLAPSGAMTQTIIGYHDLAAAAIKAFRVEPSASPAPTLPLTY